MAALRSGSSGRLALPAQSRSSLVETKVRKIAEAAYRKSAGATTDLKRVYAMYLNSQKKTLS